MRDRTFKSAWKWTRQELSVALTNICCLGITAQRVGYGETVCLSATSQHAIQRANMR